MASHAYLVDTCVLSGMIVPNPDRKLSEWIRRNEAKIAITPVILGEMRYGMLRLAPSRKRRQLEDWYERHIKSIHCLPWDAETGSTWAVLLARLDRSGRKMPVKDSLIAASALRHGLKLATLNARDFAACGLPLVDPSA